MALNNLLNPGVVEAPATGPQVLCKPIPSHVDAMVLGTANTAESYTIPTDAKYLILSADNDFYANANATAAKPSSEVTDGTGAELNPVGYYVDGQTSISFVSETAGCVITIAAYSNK